MKKPLPGYTSLKQIAEDRKEQRRKSLATSGDNFARWQGLIVDGKKFTAPQRLSVDSSFFLDECYLVQHERANYQNVHILTQAFAAAFIEKCRKMNIPMHVANVEFRTVQIAHSVFGCTFTEQENLFLWHTFKEVQRKLSFSVAPVKSFGTMGLFYLPDLPPFPAQIVKGELKLTPRAMLRKTQGHR